MNEDAVTSMQLTPYRVAYLIAGYIYESLTELEHDELDSWVEASDDNMILFEELTDERNIEANLAWMNSVTSDQSLTKTNQTPQIS